MGEEIFGAIIGIGAGLLVWSMVGSCNKKLDEISIKHNQKEEQLMQECLKDKKQYECEWMRRH